MGLRDLAGLIEAFTAWIADPARADLILNPGVGELREIYSHHLPDDATVATCASVVRLTSAAPREYTPWENIGVQILTRGLSTPQVMFRSEAIFAAALLDANRLPVRSIALNGDWHIQSIDAVPPQPLALDEKRRHLAAINLTLVAGLKPEE